MKFKYGDRVKVVAGFYQGQFGTLKRCRFELGHFCPSVFKYMLEEFEDWIDEDSLEKVNADTH